MWHWSPKISVRISSYPAWRPAQENSLTEIGTNTLRSTQPAVVGDVQFPQGNGPSGILAAWNSAVFAPYTGTHGAYIVCSGGDGDYWGNEVYVFDLGTATWTRYGPYGTGPSSNILGISTTPAETIANGQWDTVNGEVTAGGFPTPPHTYDNAVFLPPSMGGGPEGSLLWPHSAYAMGPYSSRRGHRWDIASKTWSRATSTDPTTLYQLTESSSVVDEAAKKVFVKIISGGQASCDRIRVLDFSSGTGIATVADTMLSFHFTNGSAEVGAFWTGLTGSSRYMLQLGSAIGAEPQAARLRIYNLDAIGPSYTPSEPPLAGTIPQFCYGPAMCHVPDLNASNGGVFFVKSTLDTTIQKIYKLTPPTSSPLTNAWTFAEYTMGGVAQAREMSVEQTGIRTGQGMWKRLSYARTARCLVYAIGSSATVSKMYAYVPVGLT